MFIFLLILFVCILLLPSCARADEAPAAHQRRSLQSLHDAFSSAANSQYAYSIAHRLATDLHLHNNATYGGRQAGSDAEHAAADYLADEMRRIGLSDVEKAAAKCDKWQFNGASFTVNGTEYPVYTYATASTVPEGITAPIVYVGRGTMYDYEGVDVKGKIVLVDIDQRADWWITYPMLEAEHQGAAAILAANVGGFGQVADDALNSQDICGPTSIPTCSIGVRASREIRAQLPCAPPRATRPEVTSPLQAWPAGTPCHPPQSNPRTGFCPCPAPSGCQAGHCARRGRISPPS